MSKNTGDGEKRRMVERMIIENRNSLNDPTTNEPYDVKGIANDVIELLAQEANKARLMPVSDLAWCLGKLRGLGHPAEHLEKQYGLTKEKESSE